MEPQAARLVLAHPQKLRVIAECTRKMSSTLAGNLTMVGSVANLIVVELARRDGVTISFREYCRAGVPLTVLSLVMGVVWLHFS